ncbi:MAG: hypothetical protein RBR71_07720 [Gudongella sp.]|nr:hypothetical protein [Gudongella sp.]
MKRFLSKSMIFLGVFALIMGAMTTFGINPSYADNLEVIGNDIGLEVSPSGVKLFNLTNMNPGDTNEAKVTLKNTLEFKFELFMRTERISPEPAEGDADLFKQMILTINYDGQVIYSGSMADFAQSNISLGFLNPGDNKELMAIVHLPGAETGNEFQGKSVEVRWVFIAEQRPDNPPDDPDDPYDPDDPDNPDDSDESEERNDRDKRDEPQEQEEVEIPLVDEVIEYIDEVIPESNEIIEEVKEVSLLNIPILPKTGPVPAGIYYLVGSMLLGLGIRMKNRK